MLKLRFLCGLETAASWQRSVNKAVNRFMAPKKAVVAKRAVAVFLDLDGTLHDSHRFWLEASRNAIRAMVENGFSVDGEEAFERLKQIYSKNPNSSTHYDDLLASFGYSQDPKIISAGIKAFHGTKAKALRPYPEAVSFIKFLRKRGVPVFIVTDGLPKKQWDKLHFLGLARFFDSRSVFCTGARTTSREEIPREKNAAFYKRVFQATRTQPSNAIVIGDKENADVAPPKSLGATAIKILRGKYSVEKTRADYSAKSFKQVKAIINKLLGG